MIVTKEQGRACLRAAEYIANGKWDGVSLLSIFCPLRPLENIGWGRSIFDAKKQQSGGYKYNQDQVLLTLLWCAEIAGEE